MRTSCQHVELCRMFQRQANWTMNQMDAANRIGFHFYEETVTQTILLYLASNAGSHLKIKPYSRKEEYKTGADWLFCFSQGNKNIQILVQAKRLYSNGRYQQLNVQSGQLDKLNDKASVLGAVPLYVFYNHASDGWNHYHKKEYRCSQCPRYRKVAHWGCAISPVWAIRGLGLQPSPDDINSLFPWHLLFSPVLMSNPMLHFRTRLHQESDQENFQERKNQFFQEDYEEYNLPDAVGFSLYTMYRVFPIEYMIRRSLETSGTLPNWVKSLQDFDDRSLDRSLEEYDLAGVFHIDDLQLSNYRKMEKPNFKDDEGNK